jgi:hypothetical protein
MQAVVGFPFYRRAGQVTTGQPLHGVNSMNAIHEQ